MWLDQPPQLREAFWAAYRSLLARKAVSGAITGACLAVFVECVAFAERATKGLPFEIHPRVDVALITGWALLFVVVAAVAALRNARSKRFDWHSFYSSSELERMEALFSDKRVR